MSKIPDIEKLLAMENARYQPAKKVPAVIAMKREFRALSDDHYRMTIEDIGVTLEIDRLRRERHELIGELSVACQLAGARTLDGDMLSIADMNVSSARARLDRAKMLAARALTNDLDWTGVVEDFCQRVLSTDRSGAPSKDLRTVELLDRKDAMLTVEGLVFPKRHPTILFGDGDTGKSYFALWIGGKLSETDMRVGLFDWELDEWEHRFRLGLLFPDGLPYIEYVKCERALVHETDRLRRIVKEKRLDFAIFDSVAVACDTPPEAAETATRYFRAVRQIGIGSLHIAHITKGENADQKPFGSSFWHHLARATWYAEAVDDVPDGSIKKLGLINRKMNLAKKCQALAFTEIFTEDRVTFRRSNIIDNPDLAAKLTVRERMMFLLKKGALEPARIAEEIEASLETVQRTARRYKKTFQLLEGGKIGLALLLPSSA